jgi:hypothetical protein
LILNKPWVYWQAASITQPIFVGKNAVNKHLFQSEISTHFSQKIASSMFSESEYV